MQKHLVVENDLISVWIYPARRIVHHMMKMYCYGEAFRAAMLQGAEAMASYGATKWLSDDRANGPVGPDDTEWIRLTWLPRVLAAGWRHWAIVQPVKILGQVYMLRIVKRFENRGLSVRMFDEPDEALRWLDAQ